MIHIPNPDKKLLKALADAGLLPAEPEAPAKKTQAPKSQGPPKRNRYPRSTPQPPRVIVQREASPWGALITLVVLLLFVLRLLFR